MPAPLQCYNKGCGQKYDPESNTEDSCQYHPGEPIFHDAKKKWSCCKKFSTDFSEFLSIKGCTHGQHCNIRPIEPEKPKVLNGSDSAPIPSLPAVPAQPPPINQPQPRPPATEPMASLSVEVAPSLKTLLNRLSLEKMGDVSNGSSTTQEDGESANVAVGTSCKNSGCKTSFSGTAADNDLCMYHPGVPIFHEGMKYWTCCNRKTSEFESFMDQVGCATGRHNWTEKAARATNLALSIASQASCRHDWFQLPGQVILTIYAKAVLPESVSVSANRVRLHVSFEFGVEKSRFDKMFELFGIIDEKTSLVKLMGTKVEIVLKKGEAMSWSRLEVPFSSTTAVDESTVS